MYTRRGSRVWNRSRSGRSAQFSAVISFLILVIVALVVLFGKNGDRYSPISALESQNWNMYDSLIRLDPTVEFRNGTNLIWQIPDSPKAILFLAHGCSGRAANFWDKSRKCTECVGLPEERLIVLHALARKFAVLAISSKGSCWSLGEERWVVKDVIQWWIGKKMLENLPLFALGASSGGYFVSALAMDLQFKGIVLMIAAGVFSHLDITKDYPSTLFVHMPKDHKRKQKIEKYLLALREKGIDASEINCTEFPLTPELFSNRIPGLDETLSMNLFTVFRDKGFIDENGYMRDDGRVIPWKTALEERNIILPDKSLVNHIQEEMNLAFAYHEMTSLQSTQIFDWFESHLSQSLVFSLHNGKES